MLRPPVGHRERALTAPIRLVGPVHNDCSAERATA
jgi:hypothetical protein